MRHFNTIAQVSIAQARHFLRAREGATAIEYALIASSIAGFLIAVIMSLGTNVKATWMSVAGIFN